MRLIGWKSLGLGLSLMLLTASASYGGNPFKKAFRIATAPVRAAEKIITDGPTPANIAKADPAVATLHEAGQQTGVNAKVEAAANLPEKGQKVLDNANAGMNDGRLALAHASGNVDSVTAGVQEFMRSVGVPLTVVSYALAALMLVKVAKEIFARPARA